MKNYIKPELEIENVIVEDVIAASNYISKSYGDVTGSSDVTVNW